MNNNMEIAQTILNQINVMDRMALMAWGAKDFMAIQDGVQFKIRTPKYQRGVRVRIKLNYKDLYDIDVTRVIKDKVTKLDSAEDVYFDSLIEMLDSMIDEKEKVFF